MVPANPKKNLSDYLTVGEAAEFLGVSTWTLRNWDKAGKLKPLRHPKNGYRIYRHEELAAMLDLEPIATRTFAELVPCMDLHEIQANEHFVQFYDSDEYLASMVANFLRDGLEAGDANVMIACQSHRNSIQRKLKSYGLDLTAARSEGRYVCLDAETTLESILVDGKLDRDAFQRKIGNTVERIGATGRHIRAFGEMVAILWQNANREAAIQLEEYWNELGKQRSFSLYCAYPISSCSGSEDHESFATICSKHTKVIPAESYLQLTNSTDRQRAIAQLQQKAESLEAEIAHRIEVERLQRKLEAELREQDRLKSEFLGKLAHELRNSLAPISNALDVMRFAESDSEKLEVQSIMERQVVQMTRLLDDLSDVSRMSRGKLALRVDRFSLESVLDAAIESTHPLIDSCGHQLEAILPDQGVMLEGDKSRLVQVVANLLSNSARYTEAGGRIWLTAETTPNEVVIKVRDNGIGIPSESLPAVFEMFSQVQPRRERSQKGLGIGLAVVKRIVELHSGSVSIRSDGPSQGTEVTVRLPLKAESPSTI